MWVLGWVVRGEWCGDDNIWVNINTGDAEDAGGEEGNTGDTGSDELS